MNATQDKGAQHTPGPWALKYRTPFGGGDKYFDGVVDADGREIRVEGVTLTSGPVAQANARLIAAAPELLAALQAALPYIKYPRDASDAFVMAHGAVLERAHAAIAKAGA